MTTFVFKWVENFVGKVENAGNQHFIYRTINIESICRRQNKIFAQTMISVFDSLENSRKRRKCW